MTGSPQRDESLDSAGALAVLRGRTSAKWRQHPADVLPSFIAEMDLPVADEVLAALRAHLDRGGDLGYAFSFTDDSPAQRAVADWLGARFDWAVAPSRVLYFADVTRVTEAVIDTCSAPGDAVLTDIPAYPGFAESVRDRGRELVANPMVPRGGRWRIDLDGVERGFRDGARIYLLCSPHNPTGRVHTPAELTRIAELARRYRVTVFSDEVHSPLVYPGSTHVPFAALPAAAGVRTVTGISASKAWNLAGLKCAFGVPGDAATAEALLAAPSRLRDGVGILGATASTAAFAEGGRWLAETMTRLDANRRLLGRLVARDLPEIGYQLPQATFLGWLDCRRVADRLGEADLVGRALRAGRLAVTDGADFGSPGFLRVVFATSRVLVAEQVRRLAHGLADGAPAAPADTAADVATLPAAA
ncbi:aminotransferase class I/II-fold pyridoxal phosphate-dependent enzyme [Actinokineospora auranticolor]|uniref:cysteine-S-conjugate beta-lyase n=1 Tax=Actinokineospora auranticolor TaxID=155976 RepID=A0A2S6GD17_9PSEU|nr:aminotransferase class I/II-fold pyridoxal phosphate-dependent enzyme [Actinokineospora auranticolor]PPK63147.1 cystathionine beta-lyase [Actinokineospora auranticolor]